MVGIKATPACRHKSPSLRRRLSTLVYNHIPLGVCSKLYYFRGRYDRNGPAMFIRRAAVFPKLLCTPRTQLPFRSVAPLVMGLEGRVPTISDTAACEPGFS